MIIPYEVQREEFLLRAKIATLKCKTKGASNFTYDDFFKMLESQQYKCKLCSKHIYNSKTAQIDHCHKTGAVRGLLCAACNRSLGHFRDCPDVIKKVLEYLTNSN